MNDVTDLIHQMEYVLHRIKNAEVMDDLGEVYEEEPAIDLEFLIKEMTDIPTAKIVASYINLMTALIALKGYELLNLELEDIE